jgi:hypothetical protein
MYFSFHLSVHFSGLAFVYPLACGSTDAGFGIRSSSAICSHNSERRLCLENQIVDQNALVHAVLGLELNDGIAMAEGEEAVRDRSVGV